MKGIFTCLFCVWNYFLCVQFTWKRSFSQWKNMFQQNTMVCSVCVVFASALWIFHGEYTETRTLCKLQRAWVKSYSFLLLPFYEIVCNCWILVCECFTNRASNHVELVASISILYSNWNTMSMTTLGKYVKNTWNDDNNDFIVSNFVFVGACLTFICGKILTNRKV